MEIYEKVRRYLHENIGHMTIAGTPKFDVLENLWRVPVLCKTERGIIVVELIGTAPDYFSRESKKAYLYRIELVSS